MWIFMRRSHGRARIEAVDVAVDQLEAVLHRVTERLRFLFETTTHRRIELALDHRVRAGANQRDFGDVPGSAERRLGVDFETFVFARELHDAGVPFVT